MQNYEREIIRTSIERIIENFREVVNEQSDDLFQSGRKLGYYEALNILKNDLSVANLEAQYGLDIDFDKII